jgi:hypothetical protein
MSRPGRIWWYRVPDGMLIVDPSERRPWIGSLGIDEDKRTWISWNYLTHAEQFECAMEGLDILGPHGRYVEVLACEFLAARSNQDREIFDFLDAWIRQTHAMRMSA